MIAKLALAKGRSSVTAVTAALDFDTVCDMDGGPIR
jgi:hypothetical protein